MPYIALNENDEEVTASYCRDEYLGNETVFEKFRCAFCEVRYFPRNIYVDAEIGKAPHFYVRGARHTGGCNGEPITQVVQELSAEPRRKVTKREFELPEKLVARSKPRVASVSSGVPPAALTEAEVANRRTRAGREYGPALFTSSLLQVIVDARNKLMSWCYEQATIGKMSDAARKTLIKETLESYELQLFDQKGLNYNSAFRAADFSWKSTDSRVFNAKGGRVTLTADGFVIRSEPKTAVGASSAATSRLAAEVRYSKAMSTDTEVVKSHKNLLQRLAEIAEAGGAIQWYAFSSVESLEGVNLMHLRSLDHLYFREERWAK
jgi:hypothetical protein